MTLFIRLLVIAALGVATFFGYLHYGEPRLRTMAAADQSAGPTSPAGTNAPAVIANISMIFGEYRAVVATGRYVMVLDGTGSEMRFTDKHGKTYAYRGHYAVDGSTLSIDWSAQRQGATWTPMKAYHENMTIKSVDVIETPHGTFDRAKPHKTT